jgi:hypothetical protein
MSPHFKAEMGMFSLEATVDDHGITVLQGPMRKSLTWEQVTSAVLVNEPQHKEVRVKPQEIPEGVAKAFGGPEALAKMFGGPEALAKMQEFGERLQKIAVGYRDEHGKHKLEVIFPRDDASFVQEFQSRLGKRWLGEVADMHAAEKKLHTAPGVFKTIFVLVALFGIVALLAGLAFFSMLGPVFNLLSIQRMLQNVQDGDYGELATRLLTWAALFVMAYFLRYWWRARVNAMKASLHGTFPPTPRP